MGRASEGWVDSELYGFVKGAPEGKLLFEGLGCTAGGGWVDDAGLTELGEMLVGLTAPLAWLEIGRRPEGTVGGFICELTGLGTGEGPLQRPMLPALNMTQRAWRGLQDCNIWSSVNCKSRQGPAMCIGG